MPVYTKSDRPPPACQRDAVESMGSSPALADTPGSSPDLPVSPSLGFNDLDLFTTSIDCASVKGHFGYVKFENTSVPYLIRGGKQYLPVRILDILILSQYPDEYPPELQQDNPLISHYITEAEAKLLNEINVKHSNVAYGSELFTTQDVIVKVSDFEKFLDIVKKYFLSKENNSTTSDIESTPPPENNSGNLSLNPVQEAVETNVLNIAPENSVPVPDNVFVPQALTRPLFPDQSYGNHNKTTVVQPVSQPYSYPVPQMPTSACTSSTGSIRTGLLPVSGSERLLSCANPFMDTTEEQMHHTSTVDRSQYLHTSGECRDRTCQQTNCYQVDGYTRTPQQAGHSTGMGYPAHIPKQTGQVPRENYFPRTAHQPGQYHAQPQGLGNNSLPANIDGQYANHQHFQSRQMPGQYPQNYTQSSRSTYPNASSGLGAASHYSNSYGHYSHIAPNPTRGTLPMPSLQSNFYPTANSSLRTTGHLNQQQIGHGGSHSSGSNPSQNMGRQYPSMESNSAHWDANRSMVSNSTNMYPTVAGYRDSSIPAVSNNIPNAFPSGCAYNSGRQIGTVQILANDARKQIPSAGQYTRPVTSNLPNPTEQAPISTSFASSLSQIAMSTLPSVCSQNSICNQSTEQSMYSQPRIGSMGHQQNTGHSALNHDVPLEKQYSDDGPPRKRKSSGDQLDNRSIISRHCLIGMYGTQGGWLLINDTLTPFVVRYIAWLPLAVLQNAAGLVPSQGIKGYIPSVVKDRECSFLNDLVEMAGLNFTFEGAKLVSLNRLLKELPHLQYKQVSHQQAKAALKRDSGCVASTSVQSPESCSENHTTNKKNSTDNIPLDSVQVNSGVCWDTELECRKSMCTSTPSTAIETATTTNSTVVETISPTNSTAVETATTANSTAVETATTTNSAVVETATNTNSTAVETAMTTNSTVVETATTTNSTVVETATTTNSTVVEAATSRVPSPGIQLTLVNPPPPSESPATLEFDQGFRPLLIDLGFEQEDTFPKDDDRLSNLSPHPKESAAVNDESSTLKSPAPHPPAAVPSPRASTPIPSTVEQKDRDSQLSSVCSPVAPLSEEAEAPSPKTLPVSMKTALSKMSLATMRERLGISAVTASTSPRSEPEKIVEKKIESVSPAKDLVDTEAVSHEQSKFPPSRLKKNVVVTPVQFEGSTISCIHTGPNSEPHALLEAFCKVYFPYLREKEVYVALTTALHLPVTSLTADEEMAFIQYYNLKVKKLRCYYLVNLAALTQYYMDKLRSMFSAKAASYENSSTRRKRKSYDSDSSDSSKENDTGVVTKQIKTEIKNNPSRQHAEDKEGVRLITEGSNVVICID